MTATPNTRAEPAGAEVIPSGMGLGPWLRLRRDGWILLQDRYASGPPELGAPVQLRIRAPHASRAGFRFAIRRRGGGGPATVAEPSIGIERASGDPEFDRAFRVEADDEARCLALLSDRAWRERLARLPILSLDIGGTPDPAGGRLSAGVEELRLLAPDAPDAPRALLDFCAETLETLRSLGLIDRPDPARDRLPDRYARPADRMALESIALEPPGSGRLLFDVEAIVHETREDPRVTLPPRLAALRILRNRPLPYDTIRFVRTLRAPRGWWPAIGASGIVIGLLLVAVGWGHPAVVLFGLLLFAGAGVAPLAWDRLRPAFLLIASDKTAVAIPRRDRATIDRVVNLLRDACDPEAVTWEL